MPLETAIRRYAVLFFTAFLLLVGVAFFRSYYANPLQHSGETVHAHGVAMTLWCLLLVTQGFLIRRDQCRLHRLFGWASIPLFAVNVLLQPLAVLKLAPQIEHLWWFGDLTAQGFVFLSQALLGTALFAVFYLLALLSRKAPVPHGAFMLCTVFPILAPVTDRIVNGYFPGLGAAMPAVAGLALVPLIAWVIADALLLGLAVWDWRSHRRLRVFPLAIALMAAYQVFTVNADRILLWRIFSVWFMDIDFI